MTQQQTDHATAIVEGEHIANALRQGGVTQLHGYLPVNHSKMVRLACGDVDTTLWLVEVCADLATVMLKANQKNRKLSHHHVAELCASTLEGEWVFTGDTIKFDSEGTLVDGQHRLEHVVTTGVPLVMLVVYGLEPVKARDVIDTVRVRRVSDNLAIDKEANAKNLAAAAKNLACLLETGEIRSQFKMTTPHTKRLLDQHPGLRDSVRVGNRAVAAIRAKAGLVGALHYAFSTIDKADADFFFDHLLSGVDLPANSPIAALRQRLMNDATANARVGVRTMAAWIIKAWNAFRRGDEVRQITWRPGGATPESFPSWTETVDVNP